MKVRVTQCLGLNSLGGCHRQVVKVRDMTPTEAFEAGARIIFGQAEITPRPDCDGWAGCEGGCNER